MSITLRDNFSNRQSDVAELI